MKKPILIYCGGGNERFVKIALDVGFKYGAQLPDTIYGDLYFADQNWKNPKRDLYMRYLEKYSPKMATVLDFEHLDQKKDVLSWAEEASQFVENVLLVPKVSGTIKYLPKYINGKRVILAYSVPTRYGKTDVSIDEFAGWPMHLLGGTPKKQIHLWKNISRIADVVSIDGNYFRYKAVRFCEYWVAPGKWVPDGYKNKIDACYICFEKSCANIMSYWEGV